MARIRRVEQPTSIYRDAYLGTLAARRSRWAGHAKGGGHSHGTRSMVPSIESLDVERICLACGGAQRVELIDRQVTDVEAGRPVVGSGGDFGLRGKGNEQFVLEADGTVTPVVSIHIDGTANYARPDGSLVFTTKARTRIKKEAGYG